MTDTTEAPVIEVPSVPSPGTPEADSAFKALEKTLNKPTTTAPKVAEKPAEPKEPEAPKEPETEAASDTAKDQERDDDGKFKPKVQKRIQALLKDRVEAEERASALEKQLAELTAKGEQTEDAPATEKPKKPRMADFTTIEAYEAADEKYIDELTDWKAIERERKQAKSQVDSLSDEVGKANEAAVNAKRDAFVARMESSESIFPDFKETVTGTSSVMTPAMVEYFMDSEHGPAVVYALAKDPDESKRIASLPAAKQWTELVRLEDKLTAKSPPETKAAPPPPKPALPKPPSVVRGTAPAPSDPKEAASRGDFKTFEDRMNRKQYRH